VVYAKVKVPFDETTVAASQPEGDGTVYATNTELGEEGTLTHYGDPKGLRAIKK
jgi:hypothetical protein